MIEATQGVSLNYKFKYNAVLLKNFITAMPVVSHLASSHGLFGRVKVVSDALGLVHACHWIGRLLSMDEILQAIKKQTRLNVRFLTARIQSWPLPRL